MKYFLEGIKTVEISKQEAIDILKCCFIKNISVEKPQLIKLKYNTLKIYEERNNRNR